MKHWIFDFDGTLVNSEGFFSHCLNYALNPFGVDIEDDFIERIRHKHPEKIFEDYLPEAEAAEALKRMIEVGKQIADQIEVFPGMPEVLETLKSAGASLSIWTGRDLRSTQTILRKRGIDSYFSKVITGSCVPTNKPGQDGLIEIKKFHQAHPGQMVMVGDHFHDIEPANQLGCVSVHARWKNQPVLLPAPIKAQYEFDCTNQFHQWIQQQLVSEE